MIFPPIFSSNLPSPKGPFEVGHIPLSHTPIVPFTHQQPVLIETGSPAFKVYNTSYSAFYPADPKSGSTKGKGKGVNWVPDPFWDIIRGYERFLSGRLYGLSDSSLRWIGGTLGYIAGRIKIPVHPYSPMLKTKSNNGRRYPLIVFSHGLAGTRHTYSQFCCNLASHGYVVLAVEHKDGSGPAVYIESQEEKEGSKAAQDVLRCIRHEDVAFPPGETDTGLVRVGILQIEIRQREIYEIYNSFRNLVVDGDTMPEDEDSSVKDAQPVLADLNVLGEIGEDEEDMARKLSWIRSLKGNVDVDDLRLAGHSYGGGTMLHILQTPPPPGYPGQLPIKQVLVLDPWLEAVPEPLALPSTSTESSSDMPPMLAINSVGFTHWKEHFERLYGMIKKANGNLCSIVGVKHQSFSDFSILDPRMSISKSTFLLDKIGELALSFLEGKLNKFEGKVERGANVQDDDHFENGVDGVVNVDEIKGHQCGSGLDEDGKVDGIDAKKFGDIVIHLIGKQ